MTAAITDFNQFSNLRAGADSRDPEVLREVAGQFEALFIQTMFKNMRDTSLADPVFGQSDQHEMYQDMLDKQYALEMSSGRGIGLADMLVRQLGGEDGPGVNPERQFVLPAERFSGLPGSNQVIPNEVSGSARYETGQVGSAPTWSTPQEFARQVWPFAEKAAMELNVSPEALVAQAALETGWGEHVMQRSDGTSSFNLFGIKASRNWLGGTVSKATVEYGDGIIRRERATFRAYPNLTETFDDYAEFIGGHARYQAVANHGDDTAGFASALQESGYATDPKYAEKINAILHSDVMRNALHWLKNNTAMPINTEHSPGNEL